MATIKAIHPNSGDVLHDALGSTPPDDACPAAPGGPGRKKRRQCSSALDADYRDGHDAAEHARIRDLVETMGEDGAFRKICTSHGAIDGTTVLRYLDLGYRPSDDAVSKSDVWRRPDLVELLLERGVRFDEGVLRAVIEADAVRSAAVILRRLGPHITVTPTRSYGLMFTAKDEWCMYKHAADMGAIRIIRILIAGDTPCTCPKETYAKIAAYEGHAGVLRLLLANGYTATSGALSVAAERGYAETVRVLLEAGVEPDRNYDLIARVAQEFFMSTISPRRNRVAVVRHLLAHGSACTDAAMKCAADAAGRTYDRCFFKHALDMLHMMIEHGRECSTDIVDDAIRKMNYKLVRWLFQHGQRCSSDGIRAAANDRRMLRLVLEYNQCGTDIVDYAIRRQDVQLLRILLESGKKCSPGGMRVAMRLAAEPRHSDGPTMMRLLVRYDGMAVPSGGGDGG